MDTDSPVGTRQRVEGIWYFRSKRLAVAWREGVTYCIVVCSVHRHLKYLRCLWFCIIGVVSIYLSFSSNFVSSCFYMLLYCATSCIEQQCVYRMSNYVLDKEKTVLETRRPVPSLPRLRSRLARTDRRRIAPSVTPRAPSQREAENNNI